MEATNNNVDLKYREIEREVNRHKASHPHRMLPFLWRTAAKVQKKRKRNEGHERKGVIPMTAAVSGHFWMKKGIMNRNNDDSMTGMRRITSIASLKPPSPIKIPHQGEEPCITNAASTNVAVGANAACTAAIDSISFDDPPARSLRKRALPKNAFNYDANKKPPPPKKKKVPRKRPFLPNSLPKKKFVPLRNYYHPGSFQKFSKECFGNDVDSADESDDEWRERERVTILNINDFEPWNVTENEKDMLILWNKFALSKQRALGVISRKKFPQLCFEFVKDHSKKVKEKGIEEQFMLHLSNLVDQGFISTDHLLSCMQFYHSV